MAEYDERGSGTGTPRQKLRTWVEMWRDLDRKIDAIRTWLGQPAAERGPQPPGMSEVQDMRRQRRNLRVDIMDLLDERPNLAEIASNLGFTYKGFDEEDYVPGGPPGASAGSSRSEDERGGGNEETEPTDPTDPPPPPPPPNLNRDDLLGSKGKDYEIVRTPKGGYMAVYKFRIGGQTFQIGLQIPKGKLRDYKVKEGEGKRLSKEQMARIQNIGWADELTKYMKQGDKHVIKSLVRYLGNQYEGQPILEDDQVMGVVIANSLFGWSAGEFENQLRNTKWWKNTDDYYRDWQTTFSAEKKRNAIGRTLETVVDELEDLYGQGWMKYVDGGMKQARTWAEKIASGQWGSPDAGFDWWRRRQFDKAADVNGTPAWIQNQQEVEEQRGFMNRPEDMEETLRAREIQWFGREMLDRDQRMQWANDLVTEKKADSDWEDLMRKLMRTHYSEFDENFALTQQAAPFKSLYENLMGTPTDWNNPLLQSFKALDSSGNAVRDQAMTLHDFEMLLRDPEQNPDAYKRGTRIWDESNSFAAELERMVLGVR